MRYRTVTAGLAVLGALPLLLAAPAAAVLEDNLGGLTGDQTEGYLGPLASGLSGMMSSGIFRSGRVPAAGFNFTLDARASYISFGDDDRIYTASTPGYETVEAPTVVGDVVSVHADHETLGSSVQFHYPGGFDMANFGIAVPQLTIGNVLGTRAIVRYVALNLGDEDIGDLKLLGVGGQHSISQYMPTLPLDLAFGAMFQSFDVGDVVNADAFTAAVTGSKLFGKVVSFEPYAGVGLDSFKMEAEYESGDETIEVKFDRSNDFHLTLGTNLNFPVVKLNAEFNVAAVNGFAGGVSFGY
jgi:hypothetical protein